MSHTEAPPKPIKHEQRWYHGENYILPVDDEESARLKLQHDLVHESFENRLVLCPLEIKSGDEVLDVGTGNAVWALDFLSSYQNASESNIKLVCIDISDRLFPISPPQNMSFHIQNVLSLPPDWTARFAFVHQRLLMAALKKDEWDQAVREVYRVTKDGGWAQFCEANQLSHMDGCGPATARFMQLYRRMVSAVGVDFMCSLNIESIMQRVGFVNVKTENRVAQLGNGNGELGQKHQRNMMGVFRGFKTPILRLGGLGMVNSEEEFNTLVDEMEEEWKSPGSAYAFYVITGQKPEN